MDEIFSELCKQNTPVLDIGERQGVTGYIDFISWKEVKHPIMIGRDTNGRRFIVIKMILNNQKIMQTYFQRYTNSENLWMGCGCYTRNLFYTSGGINAEQIELVRQIIKGNRPKIQEYHSPEYTHYIGHEVDLFDIQKIRAAIKIQRNWRKCRYDPKYKMCEQVLMNNLKEAGVMVTD